MNKRTVVIWVIILAVAALLLVPTFLGFFNLSPTALRIWAITATLALPGIYVLGFLSGRGAAKTALDGLNIGVEKVMAAAEQAANIKDRSFKKTVQHAKPTFNIAMLPQPQIEHRLIEGGEEVEL